MTVGLTTRQRQAFIMRANGMTNAEIAEQWGIREDSVSTMITRGTRKLGARNTVHAVAIAQAVGDIGIHEVDVPLKALAQGER